MPATTTNIGGSLDPRLRPLAAAFNDSTSHPVALASSMSGGDVTAEWHVGVSEPPTAVYEAFAFAATPICVEMNRAATTRVVVSVWELADAVLSASAADAGPLAGLTLVLVDNGPSNRAVRRTLAARGAGGFSSASGLDGAWPAAARANPRVRFIASEDEATTYIKATSNTVGFAPLAYSIGLPCATLRVSNESYTTVFNAQLTASDRPNLDLAVSASSTLSPPVLSMDGDSSYPFVDPVIVSLRYGAAAASCDAVSTVYRLGLAMVAAPTTQAVFQTWGLTALSFREAQSELGRLVQQSRCPATGEFPVDTIGGSSAVAEAAAAWTLFWPRATTSLLNYLSTGSGTGHRNTRSGEFLLGAADYPFTTEVLDGDPSLASVPAIAFALALVFNIPGVENLVVPRCVLPLLLAGNISHWDDARIADANPAAALPHLPVRVTARRPGSGTTRVFTTGIRDVISTCPELALAMSVAPSTTWPFATTEPLQSGTSSMLQHIAATPGAIGYSSSAAANQRAMPVAGIVDTTSNSVVLPTTVSVAAALSVAEVNERTGEVVPQAVASTYPFVGLTYMLMRRSYTGNCTSLQRIVEWARFGVISDDGRARAEEQGFAGLPDRMREMLDDVTRDMRCNGAFVIPRPATAVDESDNTALIIVIVVVVIILAAIAAAVVATRGGDPLAFAPLDDSKPFAVAFVSLANEGALNDAYTPDSVASVSKRLGKTVRKVVKKTQCHEAQRVSAGLFMITATSVPAILDCVATLVDEVNCASKWDSDLQRREDAATPERKSTRRTKASSESSRSSMEKSGSRPSMDKSRRSASSNSRRITASSAPDEAGNTNSSATSGTRRVRSSGGGMMKSRRHTKYTSNAATPLASADVGPPRPLVCAGVSVGFGQIDHDPELRTVAYRGDVVNAAAVATDSCVPAMIGATGTVADTVAEDDLDVNGTFDECNGDGRSTVYSKTRTESSGGSSSNVVVLSYVPFGYEAADLVRRGLRERNERRAQQQSGEGHDGDENQTTGTVASALLQKSTGVGDRKCAIVAILLPSLSPTAFNRAVGVTRGRHAGSANHKRARQLTDDIALVTDLAEEHRCHVHGIVGSTLYVSANAVGPSVAAPLIKATQFAMALTDSQLEDDAVVGVAAGALTAGEVHNLSVAAGDVCQHALAAACAASELCLPCLCTTLDPATVNELQCKFECLTVDIAQLATTSALQGGLTARLVVPVEAKDETSDEWLYNFNAAHVDVDVRELRWTSLLNTGSAPDCADEEPAGAASPPAAHPDANADKADAAEDEAAAATSERWSDLFGVCDARFAIAASIPAEYAKTRTVQLLGHLGSVHISV